MRLSRRWLKVGAALGDDLIPHIELAFIGHDLIANIGEPKRKETEILVRFAELLVPAVKRFPLRFQEWIDRSARIDRCIDPCGGGIGLGNGRGNVRRCDENAARERHIGVGRCGHDQSHQTRRMFFLPP